MNGIKKEHIVEGKKYLGLEAVAEAYQEKGVTRYAINKRYQRGMRGDDLIPEKKRKSYIPPILESKVGFTIGGIKYKSEADACRVLDVKYVTYMKRKRYGWSKEEALGLKTRKRAVTCPQTVGLAAEAEENGLANQSDYKTKISRKRNKHKNLVAFEQTYDNEKQLADAFDKEYSLIWNRINRYGYSPEQAVTKEKRGIKITLNGEEFPSLTAAAEYHGENVETVKERLKRGAPIEQALGLETYRTSTSVEYQGIVYPSLKALAEKFGLNCSGLYKALRKEGRNLEKAIEKLRHTSPKGRRSKTFFQKNPEAGNSPACLYFAKVAFEDIKPFDGKQFYKIGITSDLWERVRTLSCVENIEFTYENTYFQVEKLEAKVKERYQHKATNKLSARHLDGFTEVFEFTGAESEHLKKFVSSNLQPGELN
jgi:hypothetical protein